MGEGERECEGFSVHSPLEVIPPFLDDSPHDAGGSSMRVEEWRVWITHLVDPLAVVRHTHAKEARPGLQPPSSMSWGPMS